eukprot:m.15675 g.15675  ORF g.15675 m.15675 type:complete len:65 (+) comp10794_c0_seq2:239-433(+)
MIRQQAVCESMSAATLEGMRNNHMSFVVRQRGAPILFVTALTSSSTKHYSLQTAQEFYSGILGS